MIARDDVFGYVEVDDGVIVAVPEPGELTNSNSVIVDLGDGLLVVDTQALPSIARRVIEFSRRRFDRRVTYVVDSHGHPDHFQGNAAYRTAYPDVTVLSHASTQRSIKRDGRRWIRSQIAAWKSSQAAGASSIEIELHALEPDVPDVAVADSLEIRGKSQTVRLSYAGRAHTDGDLFVQLPGRRVVATGDVVVRWTPYMGDGYPVEWLEAIRRLEEQRPQHILMGHGHPGSFAWLRLFRTYFEQLISTTRQAMESGLPLPAAEQEVRSVLAPMFEEPLSRESPTWRPWTTLVLGNIRRVYRALEGDVVAREEQ